MPDHTGEGRILVAKESFSMRFEGADHQFTSGVSRVREGHPILRGIEHLFKPIDAHYEVEQATAAPEETRNVRLRRGRPPKHEASSPVEALDPEPEATTPEPEPSPAADTEPTNDDE